MKKEDKKHARFASIDFLRGLAIILMVVIHFAKYLLVTPEKSSTTYYLINFAALFAAPLFLFIAGISLVFSLTKRKQRARSHLIKRAIFLIIVGFLFINIWPADILHFIGLFLLISLFIFKLNKPLKIIIANIFLWLSPIILIYFVNYNSAWARVAYEFSNFWTFSGFFNNLLFNGFHPIFPWIFFTIMGVVIGEYFVNSKNNKQKNIFIFYNILIGIILTFFGIFFSFFIWRIGSYPATPAYMLLGLGGCMLLLGIFYWVFEIKNTGKKILSPIIFLGTVSFTLYLAHIIIGIGPFYLINKLSSLSMPLIIIYTIIFLIIIGFLLYLWNKKFKLGPLELLLRRFS